MSKKKKKVFEDNDHQRRAIPVIRVAPGDSEVSIDVNRANRQAAFDMNSQSVQPCCVPSDDGPMTPSTATNSSQSASITSSCNVVLTPLEVSRRRSRSRTGRKSYWRRRMEQFDQDNSSNADTIIIGGGERSSSVAITENNGSTSNLNGALQQDQVRRSSIQYQDGCIASLPLVIQVGFRRKMFSVFALQLLFISVLMVVLTYENVLSKFMQSAFEASGWYLLGTFAVMVLFLVLLYLGHAVFPINWLILLLFSVALSVFISSVQVYLNTNAGLFCCGFTFAAVSLMILMSGLKKRVRGAEAGNGTAERALMSTTKAGLIAFGVVMTISILLFVVFGSRFVSSSSAFGLSLLLEFALILWFSYDASTMYSIMSPDEYMSGVIFFYTDLLVVIVIIVVFGALALLFSSAGMGAGGFGGSCDCFGCLRVGRVFGNADNNATGNGAPITPVDEMSSSVGRGSMSSRRDSLSGAAVVPEEMLR
ncbi:Protein kinase [Globisporangium polare]